MKFKLTNTQRLRAKRIAHQRMIPVEEAEHYVLTPKQKCVSWAVELAGATFLFLALAVVVFLMLSLS